MKTRIGSRRQQATVFHHKNIRAVHLSNEPKVVQHQCRIHAGVVGLNFSKDIINQIIVMNLGIDMHRAVAANSARHDSYTFFIIVYRRFPFRQNNQGRAALV